MKIDEHLGTIEIPEIGATLRPSLSREAFLTNAGLQKAIVVVCNEPWCSYRLPGIGLGKSVLLITLQFRGQSMKSIQFCHDAPQFPKSWVEATEEGERQRKMFHDAWLTNEMGMPPGKYAWGRIESYFDAKSGGSVITISYEQTAK